jgi:hypothetical protein
MKKFQRKTIYWRICIVAVIVLTALGLSPAVIPPGIYQPGFLGMPYSLWAGMLVTLCLVIMTLIGSKVHPGATNENEKL